MSIERRPFPLTKAEESYRCSIFSVQQRTATSLDEQHKRQIYTLKCSDWVNVIPITAAGEVILVEQHRFGTDTFTIETPGGAVDPHEKDLTMAALRELEEETGLTTNRLLSLPGFPPNPAIQNNRITYFVAFDVQPLEKPRPANDPFEVIILHRIPFDEAIQMARSGMIANALSALALLLAEPLYKAKHGR